MSGCFWSSTVWHQLDCILLVLITYSRLENVGARCCRVLYLANIRKDTVTKWFSFRPGVGLHEMMMMMIMMMIMMMMKFAFHATNMLVSTRHIDSVIYLRVGCITRKEWHVNTRRTQLFDVTMALNGADK